MPKRRTALSTTVSTSSRNFLKVAPHMPHVRALHVTVARFGYRASRHHHHVRGNVTTRPSRAEHFSQQTLRTIACDRAADAPTRHHSETKRPSAAGNDEGDKKPTDPSLSPLIRRAEVFASADSVVRRQAPVAARTRHTESRWRPLRRRRASTARPAFERMRIRNPCVFLRRRRFG